MLLKGENNDPGYRDSPFAIYFSNSCDAYELSRILFLEVCQSTNCSQCFLCLGRAGYLKT